MFHSLLTRKTLLILQQHWYWHGRGNNKKTDAETVFDGRRYAGQVNHDIKLGFWTQQRQVHCCCVKLLDKLLSNNAPWYLSHSCFCVQDQIRRCHQKTTTPTFLLLTETFTRGAFMLISWYDCCPGISQEYEFADATILIQLHNHVVWTDNFLHLRGIHCRHMASHTWLG